jgi:hypothetical protein
VEKLEVDLEDSAERIVVGRGVAPHVIRPHVDNEHLRQRQ